MKSFVEPAIRSVRAEEMKLGFVGLGQMGLPIARNLLRSGARLTAGVRKDRGFEDLRRDGGRITKNMSDLAESDILFLCLPDSAAVLQVLVGDDGLLMKLGSGKVIVDLSTITYSSAVQIGKTALAQGIEVIDAPVSGMEARAVDATLTVMCGGARDTFDQVRPLLDLIGNKILFMGPSGSGQLAKLINQLLFDVNAAAVAELLPVAVKVGLDPTLIGEVVNSGTGRSYASEFFIPRILRGHFSDGYPMRNAYKDLISGAELSANLCVPLPVLAAATATYQQALRMGFGGDDKGAMIKVFEKLLDVECRTAASGPDRGTAS